ncbi:MAG: phosphatidate cytidylyltransferase [Bacteroidales bacterium]|nr:phosphatidate cytidylyltransferase [Bacteroidales bacterium]
METPNQAAKKDGFLRNFLQRAVTGIVFVAVIGAAFLLGPYTYAMVLTSIVTLASIEYGRLIRAGGYSPHVLMALGINIVAFALGFLVNVSNIDYRMLLLVVGLVWLMFLVELFSTNPNPLTNIALTMLCCVYVGIPFALFNLLAFKSGTYDYRPILGLFALVWVNDTGAYLCGVSMGRHKLYERISPKKTVEGFIGGVILTMLVGWSAYAFFDDFFFHAGLSFALISAAIVAIFGTAGDLIESMFKRSVSIKDSGRILPGHGGVLDRFDAVIFVSPIVSLIYYFFT